MDDKGLDWDRAVTYAGWFRALSDPRRVQVLHVLATAGRALRVGEVVERVEVGQSTVSEHLRVLAEARFVLVERRGTASWYRVNEACLECFPSAADVVMGRGPVRFDQVPDGCDVPEARESAQFGGRDGAR